jgi:hypothetical protein
VIIEPKYIQTSELDITYPTRIITLHTTPPLQKRTHQRYNRRTPRHTLHNRTSSKRRRSRRRAGARAVNRTSHRARRARDILALGRSHTRHAGSRRRRRRPQGLSSVTVGGDGVLDRRLLERVGAVVVANEDVGVDVAQADEVVGVGVTGVDAGFVAGDAGVDDAESCVRGGI